MFWTDELISDQNKIKELPAAVGKLKNLEVLNASRINLRFCQKKLVNSKKVQINSLGSNDISRFARVNGNLKQLRHVELENNKLISTSGVLLSALKRLDFYKRMRTSVGSFTPENFVVV